jgi:hypothetical protein
MADLFFHIARPLCGYDNFAQPPQVEADLKGL